MAHPGLDVRFGAPEHGWLAIEIVTPEWRHADDASDVPCDSLAMLVNALLALAAGELGAHVEWSLEPSYSHWHFTVEDENLLFTVTDAGGRERHTQLPLTAALRVFCQSLFRLRSDPAWTSLPPEEVWSWDFPSESLDALKRRVLHG